MRNQRYTPVYYDKDSGREYIEISTISRYIQFNVQNPLTEWELTHEAGDKNVVVDLFDENGVPIAPSNIKLFSNYILVTFDTAKRGTARVTFLDREYTQ